MKAPVRRAAVVTMRIMAQQQSVTRGTMNGRPGGEMAEGARNNNAWASDNGSRRACRCEQNCAYTSWPFSFLLNGFRDTLVPSLVTSQYTWSSKNTVPACLFSNHNTQLYHRHRSSVNFGGKTFLPEIKLCTKRLTKCPKFTR